MTKILIDKKQMENIIEHIRSEQKTATGNVFYTNYLQTLIDEQVRDREWNNIYYDCQVSAKITEEEIKRIREQYFKGHIFASKMTPRTDALARGVFDALTGWPIPEDNDNKEKDK